MAESRGIDIRRQADTSLLFAALALDTSSAKVTSGTMSVRLWHVVSTTGALEAYDFNDNTFKTTALTTPTASATHRTVDNSTYNTGLWTYRHSTLTAFTVGDKFIVEFSHASMSPTIQQRIWQYGGVEGDSLEPTVAGRTLDVTTTGEAEAVTGAGAAIATATSVSTLQSDVTTIDTVVDSIQSDTNDIQARLPAALVGGRIDASVGAIATGAVTADAIATDAIGSLELAAGAATEIANAVVAFLPGGTPSITGTVVTGVTPTTATFKTDLPSSIDNFYVGMDLIVSTATNNDLVSMARRVTGYTGSTKVVTFSQTWPTALSVGDGFRLNPGSDPLSTQVAGNYGSGTGGAALGRIGSGQIVVTSPVASSGAVTIIRGDDYSATDSRALEWTVASGSTWPDLTSATITVYFGSGDDSVQSYAGSVVTPTGAGAKVRLELTSAQTTLLTPQTLDFNVEATLATSSRKVTLARGIVTILPDVRDV